MVCVHECREYQSNFVEINLVVKDSWRKPRSGKCTLGPPLHTGTFNYLYKIVCNHAFKSTSVPQIDILIDFAFQFVETKCSKPGQSVPSPFDSCNICLCTDEGIIEG